MWFVVTMLLVVIFTLVISLLILQYDVRKADERVRSHDEDFAQMEARYQKRVMRLYDLEETLEELAEGRKGWRVNLAGDGYVFWSDDGTIHYADVSGRRAERPSSAPPEPEGVLMSRGGAW